MGRIVTTVRVRNVLREDCEITCDALVDTGASQLVLPRAWKSRLGELKTIREMECETATQGTVTGEVCGLVEIQIEGFDPVFGETLFLEMVPDADCYEPLLGYIVLEQSQAAIDLLGHRLIHVKRADLK